MVGNEVSVNGQREIDQLTGDSQRRIRAGGWTGIWRCTISTFCAMLFLVGVLHGVSFAMADAAPELRSGVGNNAEQYGYVVTGLGDINGDSKDDIAISAPYADFSTLTDAGCVYIFFGKSTSWNAGDLDSTNANVKIYGSAANEHFGTSIGKTNDINGDGKNDLIIGSPDYSSNKGRAYVVLGRSNWTSVTGKKISDSAWGSTIVTIEGKVAGDKFGKSVAGINLNGGNWDVLVGASGYSSSKGAAFGFDSTTIISKVGTTIDYDSANWQMTGEATGNEFGTSVANAGDIDGNSYSDVVIGAPSYSSSQGRAYIYKGGSSITVNSYVGIATIFSSDGYSKRTYIARQDGKVYYTPNPDYDPSEWAQYGTGASQPSAGTYVDIATTFSSSGSARRAFILKDDGTVYYTPYANLVSSSWDIYASSNPPRPTGTSYVSIASTFDSYGDTIRLFVLRSDGRVYWTTQTMPGTGWGWYGSDPESGSYKGIASTFNSNGMQKNLFILRNDNKVFLTSYPDSTGTSWTSWGHGAPTGTWVGISSSYDSSGGSKRAYILRNDNIVYYTATADYQYTWWDQYGYGTPQPPTGNYMGIATTFDTSDGSKNVFILKDTGKVYYTWRQNLDYSQWAQWGTGTPQPPLSQSLSPDITITGENANDKFGLSVSTAGSVNGDNYKDILIGAPGWSTSTGRTYVVFGGSSLPSSIPASNANVKIAGAAAGDQFGYSVAYAGNLDDKNYDDIIIGAPYNDHSDKTDCGAAYIYYADASFTGTKGTSDSNYDAYGGDVGENFGFSVAGALSIDGDIWGDLVVGGKGFSVNNGKIHILAPSMRDDYDGDGLSNYYETHTYYADVDSGMPHYTDPFNPDTDGDGLWDGWHDTNRNGIQDPGEVAGEIGGWYITVNGAQQFVQSNPLKQDTDNDQLLDNVEYNGWDITVNGVQTHVKSNPSSSNTDGDGISDSDEYNGVLGERTDPQNADTDNDGLTDCQELVTYHTSAIHTDSDGDGLTDGQEVNGWNINVNGVQTHVSSNPLSNDTDDDGIPDWVEYNGWDIMVNNILTQVRSNPSSSDTDGDGLSDTVEYNGLDITVNGAQTHMQSNPSESDTDNDGLSDTIEYNGWDITVNGVQTHVGSNPSKSNTDGDGFSDLEEYNGGDITINGVQTHIKTNPSESDTDNDGLADDNEYVTHGTDPTRADTDNDGMPDGWEVQYGLKPLDDGTLYPDYGPNGDLDTDGLPNLAEYRSGSDPFTDDSDHDGLKDGIESPPGAMWFEAENYVSGSNAKVIDDPFASETIHYPRKAVRAFIKTPYIYSYDDETWSYNLEFNTWSKLNMMDKPPARFGHDMAYDPVHNKVILAGGRVQGWWLTDIWEYDVDSGLWSVITQNSNVARTEHAMAYDSKNQKLVLFGGKVYGDHIVGGTWILEGDHWEEKIQPKYRPSPRASHAMAYDSGSNKIVLFGGQTSDGAPNGETWVYNTKDNYWGQVFPTKSPTPRYGHAMTYDSQSDRIILFGGMTSAGISDETWAFNVDDGTWTQITTTTSPPGRYSHEITYDSHMDQVILFGGRTVTSNYDDTTWSFKLLTSQTGEWYKYEQSTSNPIGRNRFALCYFGSSTNSALLFGGYNGLSDNEIARIPFNTQTANDYIILVKARSPYPYSYLYGDLDGWVANMNIELTPDYKFVILQGEPRHLEPGSHTLTLSMGGSVEVFVDKLVIYPLNFDRLITDPTDPDTDSDGVLDGTELPEQVKWYDIGYAGDHQDPDAGGGAAKGPHKLTGGLYLSLENKIPAGSYYNIMFRIKGGSQSEYRIEIHHDGIIDLVSWIASPDKYSWVSANGIISNSQTNSIIVSIPNPPASVNGYLDAIVIVPTSYLLPFSNPQDPDTDHDGSLDGREYRYNSNPLEQDVNDIAIIVVGGRNSNDNSVTFWNDATLFYQTLRKNGYGHKNIIFLYADGNPPSTQNCANCGGGAAKFLDYDDIIINGPGTKQVFYDTLSSLQSLQLTRLTLWIEDHGGDYDEYGNQDKINRYLYLWDDNPNDNFHPAIKDTELNEALSYLTIIGPTIIIVESCMSGGFIDDLSSTSSRIVVTSNTKDLLSYPGDTCTWNLDSCYYWDGQHYITKNLDAPEEMFYSEFAFHFINAILHISPWRPGPTGVGPDMNGDGKVSIAEAFSYAAFEDSMTRSSSAYWYYGIEIPQYDDNGDGFSHQDRDGVTERIFPLPTSGDGYFGALIFL